MDNPDATVFECNERDTRKVRLSYPVYLGTEVYYLYAGCRRVRPCEQPPSVFSSLQDSARIDALGASYQGFKFAVLAMANMTDGLPWPLKAAPQTAPQVLQQLEVRENRALGLISDGNLQDFHQNEPKIQDLRFAIRDLCQMFTEQHGKRPSDDPLIPHLRSFFEYVPFALRVGDQKFIIAE